MKLEQALALPTKVRIIGCDPGPTHSAIVYLDITRNDDPTIDPDLEIAWSAYLPNKEFRLESTFLSDKDRDPSGGGVSFSFLVYEGVGAFGRFVGATTFDTAAVGGEIRHLFRPLTRGLYCLRPQEWRYRLTGHGGAKTPEIYEASCELFEPLGGGSNPFRGVQRAPGPLWDFHQAGKGGKMDHMKDALGVALAAYVPTFARKSIEEFRIP